uniref:Uncharacterized protein n=1 Tax=viral metagenome TaxID=1070528 RepID=A0A6M3IQX0_9ZZZZ
MVQPRTKVPHELEWIRQEAAEIRKKEEETRLKYKPLNDALSKYFKVEPDKPYYLESKQAQAYDFNIPDTWRLKIWQEPDTGELSYRQVTPAGWEVTETSVLSPTGEQFTWEEVNTWEDTAKFESGIFQQTEPDTPIESIPDPMLEVQQPMGMVWDYNTQRYMPATFDLQVTRNFYKRNPEFLPPGVTPTLTPDELDIVISEQEARREELTTSFMSILPDMFEDVTEETQGDRAIEIINQIATNEEMQDVFIDALQEQGRNAETENILRLIQPEITDNELTEFFGTTRDGQIATETPQSIVRPEPLWESIRTGEVLTQSEKDKLFPTGYEIELDEWTLTRETSRNYIGVFKILGEGLTKLPRQLGASILQSFQGYKGASVVNKDWADKFIGEAQTDLNKFAQDTVSEYGNMRLPISVEDLATLPQSIAFSLTSMGGGLVAGIPVALAPVPGARVAAWGIGSTASGAVAFGMASYQIMQQYLELKNEEMKNTVGRELTLEEENTLKKDFSNKAVQYGLWEAIPEAVSNLAFGKLLTLPLSKMIGRTAAIQILTKIGGMYGEEFLTETITQKGQSAIEVEAGLRDEKITWVEAFKEIAPQTFLLTTILGGAGQITVSSVSRIKKSLKKEIGDEPIFNELNSNITEDVFAEVEAEAAMIEAPTTATEAGVTPAKGVTPPVTEGVTKKITRTTKQQDIQETARILTGKLKESGIPERDIADLLDVYGISTKSTSIEASVAYEQLRLLGYENFDENNVRNLSRVLLSKEFGVPTHEIDLVLQGGSRINPNLDVQEAIAKAKEINNLIKGNLPSHKEIVASLNQGVPQVTPTKGVTPQPITEAPQRVPEPPKWYRGTTTGGIAGQDTFWTSDKSVAGDYGTAKVGEKPKIATLTPADMPDNVYETTNKETIVEELGITIDPYTGSKGAFDKAVKEILQPQGYDAVKYSSGTFEAEELHIFGKPISEPLAPAVVPETEEVSPEDIEVIRQLNELQKMYDIWHGKLVTLRQVKLDLAKFVQKNLPMNVRGKFITAVGKVETNEQLQIQLDKVRDVAEKNAQKVLTNVIEKKLDKAKPYIENQIKKGKFTPETQTYLNTLIHNLHMNRDDARAQMLANRMAYQEGTMSQEQMLKANDALNFAGIEGMTAAELKETSDYIDILMLIGKSERQAKQDAYQEKMDAIRTEVGADGVIGGGRGLLEGVEAIPGIESEPKKGWFEKFVNWQYSWDNLLDKLSKFDKISKPYQSALNKFGSAVHRATQRQTVGTKDAFTSVKKAVADAFHVKGNRDLGHVLDRLDEEVDFGVVELSQEYVAAREQTPEDVESLGDIGEVVEEKVAEPKEVKRIFIHFRMTRNQMIAKYMQMQDPTLDNTFLAGMGWTQKMRDMVENAMTSEEIALANSFFKFYDDYYQTVNPIYREMFNIDMPYNPRYSPIRREADINVPEDILLFEDAMRYASALNGSIKSRIPNARGLRFDSATDILSNHITQMEHFKAWALTMRDMRQVFSNHNIRTAISQYHGKGILKVIDKFLNDMARGGIETAATFKAADYLRRAFTKSILAIKPVVAIKQIPSMFAYISEMPVTRFLGGVINYWANPIENFKFLYANSEGFRARVSTGFERDIRAALEKHGKKQLIGSGSFTDWFLLQIRLGDAFAVTQGTWATYQYAMKSKAEGGLGMTSAEALAHAEDVTNRTQPSFGIDTLSAFQNGSSFHKLLTMFMNQPNKYFRLVGDNLRNFQYGRGSRAKAASTVVFTWVVLPMLFQFIADAFQWKPERQLRAGLLGQLNHIFVAGQALQILTGILTKEPFDYQVSPVLQAGEDVFTAVSKAVKMVDQGLDPYKDISVDDGMALIEYLAKAGGEFTGLPTPYFVQLEKAIRHKFEAGEDLAIKDFLFSEWALEQPRKGSEQKVDDITLELGEVKEGQEDVPLTKRELKLNTTVDWLRGIGEVYKKVLPQDVLNDKRSSLESKTWAAAEIASSKANILPNVKLYEINTDDDDYTIIELRKLWIARNGIGSLEKLKAYDDLYANAGVPITHGNVNKQQNDLLEKYLFTEDKKQFLIDHKDELSVNPLIEYLKDNPTDNALLAMKGEANLLTMKAYDEFHRLVKELDIPEDAIPDRVLPLNKHQAQSHFDYLDNVSNFGAGSAEADLVLAKDSLYTDWADLQRPEKPIAYYQMKVDNRELFDKLKEIRGDELLDSVLTDEEGLTEKGRAIIELRATKVGDETFHDIERRISAISKGTAGNPLPQEVVDAHVEYGKVIDLKGIKFQGAEENLFRIDNDAYNKSRLDKTIWGINAFKDDVDRTQETKWRLQVQYRPEFTTYDEEIPQKYADMADEELEVPEGYNSEWWDEQTPDEQRNILIGVDRNTMNMENEKFRDDARRIEAYELKIPEVEEWVEFNNLPISGKRRDRYIIEHGGTDPKNPTGLAKSWSGLGTGHDLPDPTTIPSVRFDEITEEYQDEFDLIGSSGDFSNIKSDQWKDDTFKDTRTGLTEREQATYDLRFDKDGKLTDFGKAEVRRNGYGMFMPEDYIERWVDYGIQEKEGRPTNWPTTRTGIHTWYEDDWYLKEHPKFYEVLKGIMRKIQPDWHMDRDAEYWSKVPTRDVFDLYVIYEKNPSGKPREDLRYDNSDLEKWLLLTGKVTKPIKEKRRRASLSPSEKWETQVRAWEELAK